MSNNTNTRRLNFLPFRQPSALSENTESRTVQSTSTPNNMIRGYGMIPPGTVFMVAPHPHLHPHSHPHPMYIPVPARAYAHGDAYPHPRYIPVPARAYAQIPEQHSLALTHATPHATPQTPPHQLALTHATPHATPQTPPHQLALPTPTPAPNPHANMTWDSAGIIVIEDKYHDQKGFNYQAIFLGRNPNTKKFELFYGNRDSADNSPIETAQRNCAEVTSNMFRFSPRVFNQSFCVRSTDKKHLAYVIRVQPKKYGIQSKIFYQNRTTLNAGSAPDNWFELSNITRISIKEAISSGILDYQSGPDTSDFTMFDVYDNSVTICGRDAEFIRDAIHVKMNISSPVHTLRFIPSYDDKFNGNKNRYLNSTSCYTV